MMHFLLKNKYYSVETIFNPLLMNISSAKTVV